MSQPAPVPRPSSSALGALGEEAAAAWLESQGYAILTRNLRARSGEVDLIARNGDVVVFVEVKTRSGQGYGHPAEAVVAAKQRRLVRAAAAFLVWGGFEGCCVRFDIIGVHMHPGGRVLAIEHITDAFGAGQGMI